MKRMGVSIIALGMFLSGCAPSAQLIKLKTAEITQLGKEKIAIINGYYGKKNEVESAKEKTERDFFEENSPLLPPEGDGGAIPCSVKCIDNCDEQCKIECHDLWEEMCGDDEEYVPPPIADFDWEGKTVEHQAEIEKPEPKPDSVVSKNNAPGDNNNQTNIAGSNNRVLVQGGGGPNNMAIHPIEQVMADILKSKISPLKPNAEIIGEQVRGLIRDTADAAVKVAPSVLTGTAIIAAGAAVKDGFHAAGDKYELNNSNNPVDNSIYNAAEEAIKDE